MKLISILNIQAIVLLSVVPVFATEPVSNSPLRRPIIMADRPLSSGPGFYVDPVKGLDSNPGTEARPWKTVQASLEKLRPGDTLYLAGGVYFEHLYCAMAGRPDAPITIRSKPGETAIIDGGLPEFEVDPAKAWEPVAGTRDEYQSTKTYFNIRDVIGLFGDSNIGLQTYWHPEDLRATNEYWIPDPAKKAMVLPVYCGPGVWYDRTTGRIHVRLAHTNIANPGISNYAGETDPRKLPLVLAPFNSTPLMVDLAMYVRFQDLVFRGAGLNNLFLRFGVGIELDHITVYGGTYCIRAKNSGPVKLTNSGIYGGLPPWAFWDDMALAIGKDVDMYSDPYTKGPHDSNVRNIARLNSHALVVMEGGEESDVFCYPWNNRWDISQCEFADGDKDGVYCNGVDLRMHNNWIGNIEDNAIYLSSPTPTSVCKNVRIYENYITGCTTAFSAHARGGPEGSIYIYGNVVDLRTGIRWKPPTLKDPAGKILSHNFFFMHGSKNFHSIESIYFWHNTVIASSLSGFAGGAANLNLPDSARHVCNNIFVYLDKYPLAKIDEVRAKDFLLDGNIYWSPSESAPKGWLDKLQALSYDTHSFIGSPGFAAFDSRPEASNDYRPIQGSPEGVAQPIPAGIDLENIGGSLSGAFQKGSGPLKVGVGQRILAGAPVQ